jgi:hypothetical protein
MIQGYVIRGEVGHYNVVSDLGHVNGVEPNGNEDDLYTEVLETWRWREEFSPIDVTEVRSHSSQ